jgi:apolipoprotein N-acyltransferase
MAAFRVVLLALAFAVLVTAHVSLLAVLAFRRPRWRAIAALVIPPLAPYWGWQERRHVASSVWVFGAIAYVVSLLLTLR